MAIVDLRKLCQAGELDTIDLVAVIMYARVWTKPRLLAGLIGLAIVPVSVVGSVLGAIITAQDSHYDYDGVHRWQHRD